MICDTRSRPYLLATYSMTRSRPSMQKSTSKSGIDTRSGFKNRSNRRSCSIGSRSVMPEHVGDQRSRAGAAARTHRHAVLARPADEIRHDQEVSGEAHGANDAKLEIEPGLVGRRVPQRGCVCSARRDSSPRSDSSRRNSFGARSVRHRIGRQAWRRPSESPVNSAWRFQTYSPAAPARRRTARAISAGDFKYCSSE